MKHRNHYPASLVALLAFASTIQAEPTNDPCRAGVTLEVSGGTEPTFHWAAACPVQQIIVENNWANKDSWVITAESNVIEPDVVYGRTPQVAVE